MYLIGIDHLIYEPRGGGAFTLPAARRELRGTANAKIYRLDGTLVVANAGSTCEMIHIPSGRRVAAH